MKLALPLVAALLVTACKSDPPVTDEPQAPTQAEIKAYITGQAKLLSQKLSLEKKLNKLILNSKDASSEEMELILKEKQQALIDLQTIRSTHPSLQKLNKELTLWQSNHRSARHSKRESDLKQAMVQISKISSKIHTLSKELPVIREAEDRIARSEKELTSARRSLAEKTPEGQALVKKIAEIQANLSKAKKSAPKTNIPDFAPPAS